MSVADSDEAFDRHYTIYRHVGGTEPCYTLREILIRRDGATPGEVLADGVSLQEARDAVPRDHDHCLFRSPGDHESIVETWI